MANASKEKEQFFLNLIKEGRLIVNEKGQVFNGRTGREYLGVDGNGYKRVNVRGPSGKTLSMLTHRLIFIHFKGEISIETEVNHVKGLETGARLKYLEATTASENMKHACNTGLLKASKGERNGQHKLTEKDVRKARKLKAKMSYNDLAEMFGVSKPTMISAIQGKTWKHI